ncbi:unnamed protein product [Protopolystoma xenopodis]|uniref:Uncharacterized protein n=1 Tax=Protopolystoma xenopodis TaxID=117903 RepID=A0A3S5AD11_9PLAT|nr:unnamed protein product [Protopolystoma xenopodis]
MHPSIYHLLAFPPRPTSISRTTFGPTHSLLHTLPAAHPFIPSMRAQASGKGSTWVNFFLLSSRRTFKQQLAKHEPTLSPSVRQAFTFEKGHSWCQVGASVSEEAYYTRVEFHVLNRNEFQESILTLVVDALLGCPVGSDQLVQPEKWLLCSSGYRLWSIIHRLAGQFQQDCNSNRSGRQRGKVKRSSRVIWSVGECTTSPSDAVTRQDAYCLRRQDSSIPVPTDDRTMETTQCIGLLPEQYVYCMNFK